MGQTWKNVNDRIRTDCNTTGESMTAPDQTLSIKQIKLRYAQGLPVKSDYRLQWGNEGQEVEIPVMKDLTDIDNAKSFLEKLQKEIQQAESLAKDGKLDKKAQKELIDPDKDQE